MPVILGILFWVIVIIFFVSGVRNKKTRAATLTIAGIIFVLFMILFVMFCVYISKGLKWKEGSIDTRDKAEISRVIDEDNVELFTNKYYNGAFIASTQVYMTEWYDSLDDLSDALVFEDDEKKDSFDNSMVTPADNQASLKKLFKEKGHDDVVLYKVNFSKSSTNCYIVNCTDTKQVALIIAEYD